MFLRGISWIVLWDSKYDRLKVLIIRVTNFLNAELTPASFRDLWQTFSKGYLKMSAAIFSSTPHVLIVILAANWRLQYSVIMGNSAAFIVNRKMIRKYDWR